MVGFSTTNFTRAWEPTLSWNQLRSLTSVSAKGDIPWCAARRSFPRSQITCSKHFRTVQTYPVRFPRTEWNFRGLQNATPVAYGSIQWCKVAALTLAARCAIMNLQNGRTDQI